MAWHLIRAAAKLADVAPETVREYCKRGLLTPVRDSSGRRLFTDDDIRRIREIFLNNMSRRSKWAENVAVIRRSDGRVEHVDDSNVEKSAS